MPMLKMAFCTGAARADTEAQGRRHEQIKKIQIRPAVSRRAIMPLSPLSPSPSPMRLPKFAHALHLPCTFIPSASMRYCSAVQKPPESLQTSIDRHNGIGFVFHQFFNLLILRLSQKMSRCFNYVTANLSFGYFSNLFSSITRRILSKPSQTSAKER